MYRLYQELTFRLVNIILNTFPTCGADHDDPDKKEHNDDNPAVEGLHVGINGGIAANTGSGL